MSMKKYGGIGLTVIKKVGNSFQNVCYGQSFITKECEKHAC